MYLNQGFLILFLLGLAMDLDRQLFEVFSPVFNQLEGEVVHFLDLPRARDGIVSCWDGCAPRVQKRLPPELPHSLLSRAYGKTFRRPSLVFPLSAPIVT